jgi:hypothetical protein
VYYIYNIFEEINKFLRKEYIWFFPVLSATIFEVSFKILYAKEMIDLTNFSHSTLLGISLTLSGFLLTGIGIMISVRDKPFIQTLIRAGYWKNIESSNFLGIVFTIISSMICLYNMILKNPNYYFTNIELLTFIIGITYFVIVVVWLKKSLEFI